MSDVQVERKDKMKQIAIETIIVSDRAREDLGDIDELVKSIKEKGVIQPITLDDKLNLLAGGRRVAASKIIGLKFIPAIIRPFVDALDSAEIELIENIHRKDFTWQERVKLTKKIDDFYKAKDPNWSGRKTAELLDRSSAGVADAIQMAQYLEVIPELGQLKTADEARKFIKNVEMTAVTDELKRRQDERLKKPEGKDAKQAGINAALRQADSNYIIKDCFDGMASLRTNGNINFIECDPPYGIDLNEQKGSKDTIGSTVDGYKEVSAGDYPAFLKRLAEETYRVAGRDCWMVFWYGPTWHHQVLTTLREAGWLVDEIPAIWTKYTGQTLQPELYLARSYEPFFICRKGKPIIAERGRLNVFNFAGDSTSGPNAKYHPTQRPIQLITAILKTFLVGTQHVFVPFLGSGATLRACYFQGHVAFGYDLDGKYKDKFMLKVEEDSRKLMADDATAGIF
jgi:ParB/RepB/Spo0J family partition protein